MVGYDMPSARTRSIGGSLVLPNIAVYVTLITDCVPTNLKVLLCTSRGTKYRYKVPGNFFRFRVCIIESG